MSISFISASEEIFWSWSITLSYIAEKWLRIDSGASDKAYGIEKVFDLSCGIRVCVKA